MNREQKAREIAMRRRLGASPAHAAKVKANMLAQNDLHTTCQKCHQRVSGTLNDIQRHVEQCDGD